MSHFTFIFAAYSISAIGLICFLAIILWRHKILTKKIALLQSLDTMPLKTSKYEKS